jgi:hypothetical protein
LGAEHDEKLLLLLHTAKQATSELQVMGKKKMLYLLTGHVIYACHLSQSKH